VWAGLLYMSVCRTFATIWRMPSQIKFDCSLLLVDCMSLTLKIWSKNWNTLPMNSPPLSWIHQIGCGCLVRHSWINLLLICSYVL
jgi:hypothetical protein